MACTRYGASTFPQIGAWQSRMMEIPSLEVSGAELRVSHKSQSSVKQEV